MAASHLDPENKDVPCTYAINFRIRDDSLRMSVHMRSQDAIFGMTNDVVAFSFLHEMVYVTLKFAYPNLRLGTYHHSVDSFHVYERHFNMLDKLVLDPTWYKIDCPRINDINEVLYLLDPPEGMMPLSQHRFATWLYDIQEKTDGG